MAIVTQTRTQFGASPQDPSGFTFADLAAFVNAATAAGVPPAARLTEAGSNLILTYPTS